MARRTGKNATQERLYIAYGSNLNLPQMERRCPTAKVVGTSEIKNYELLFRGVATVEPKEGASVPILLWKIETLDEAALDRYEGWPHLYRKEMMDVELEGKLTRGQTIAFFGYQINKYPEREHRNVRIASTIEGKRFMNLFTETIIKGSK